MRAFAPLPKAAQQTPAARSAASSRGFPGKSADMASSRPAYDFSQISIHPRSPAGVQAS